MSPRAAVTGLGVVSALGQGRALFLSGLREGRSGLISIAHPHAPAETTAVGKCDQEKWDRVSFPPKWDRVSFSVRRASRADWLALTAVLEAADDAKLPRELVTDAAVILGVGAGG